MNKSTAFKTCSCGTAWPTREDFLRDLDTVPIGISFHPDLDSRRAFFFFNHATCKTTLVIDSEDFADLIKATVPADIKADEEECEGHCTKKEDLELCSVECRNAPFRRFFIEHILNKEI
jgi:hypothetical protein